MANWYGTARSNYFKVKDEAAFREAMQKIGLAVLEGNEEQAGMFAVTPDTEVSDDGGWPNYTLTEDGEVDDEHDIDVAEEVAAHLVPGYVAVFVQSGAEKLRYVDGYAEAVDHTGKRVDVSLRDIYVKAAQEFKGSTITEAKY